MKGKFFLKFLIKNIIVKMVSFSRSDLRSINNQINPVSIRGDVQLLNSFSAQILCVCVCVVCVSHLFLIIYFFLM